MTNGDVTDPHRHQPETNRAEYPRGPADNPDRHLRRRVVHMAANYDSRGNVTQLLLNATIRSNTTRWTW